MLLKLSYLRDVVDAEGWRQLIRVSEGDLVGGPLQGDLCPQEETVPQCVPVQTNINLKPVKYFRRHVTRVGGICFRYSVETVHSVSRHEVLHNK